jgi:hypothetical protein
MSVDGCRVLCGTECFIYARTMSTFSIVISWLRYYDTGRKVAGSTADGAIIFFNVTKVSSRTMAQGSTQLQCHL